MNLQLWLRTIFSLGFLFGALMFIFNAVKSWNTSPVVTSGNHNELNYCICLNATLGLHFLLLVFGWGSFQILRICSLNSLIIYLFDMSLAYRIHKVWAKKNRTGFLSSCDSLNCRRIMSLISTNYWGSDAKNEVL